MSKTPFTKNLSMWYKKNKRDLPWRKTRDPYKIWISEIMLQQTTVAAVIPYFNKWIKKFPTVQSVARARLQTILKSWQGLGYYSRARNIHKAAKLIVKNYNGRIPKSPEELKKLPGFGPYTVGAVLSIAYDLPEPIIDANIRRVVMRLVSIEGEANTTQDSKVLAFVKKNVPQKGANVFNQAMMELGALVCRNREPLCNICPVKTLCRAYKKGIQDIIPTPKKKEIKDVYVAIALLKQNGDYFIQRRPPKGLFADLWEFPGGKIEKGETAKEAVKREVNEELEIKITDVKHLLNVKQYYTEFRANLSVFECETKDILKISDTCKLINKNDLRKYPMPSGSAKIVDFLLN